MALRALPRSQVRPHPDADYYALYGIFKSSNYPHPGTETFPHTHDFVALNPADAPMLKHLRPISRKPTIASTIWKARRIKFASDAEKEAAEKAIREQVKQIEDVYPYSEKAYAMSEATPVNAHVFIKGEPKTLGPEVPRGFLTILGGQKIPAAETGSGRLELANWVADRKNPLTARVMVNRVWKWHFGQGLVSTPDDFGVRGEKPSHPELLGLSGRAVHGRRLVHEEVAPDDRTLADLSTGQRRQPARQRKRRGQRSYHWRFDRRRLEAEEIRDSLLAVSGNLDPAPGRQQPFPPEMEWKYTQHEPFLAAYDTNQRAVYLMQQRIRRQPFLDLFDGADPNAVTGSRPLTTSALQALFTMNDPFFHEQAAALARRTETRHRSDLERLRYAYQLVYGRLPAPEEIRETREYLSKARAALAGSGMKEDRKYREAWASLMRVLLSSNEFLSLD